jgi:hypothetical protein
MSDKALQLHKETIVVDGLNAVYPKDVSEDYWRSLKAGGVGALKVTIPDVECFSMYQAVLEIADWSQCLRAFEPSGCDSLGRFRCGDKSFTYIKIGIHIGKISTTVIAGRGPAGLLGKMLEDSSITRKKKGD